MKILFGYVDPGVGLLMWQTVVAALVGTVFYLRKTRVKLVAYIQKLLRLNSSARPSPVTIPVSRDPAQTKLS